ncbi:MAG: signal peptidase II [Sarcina sp.]
MNKKKMVTILGLPIMWLIYFLFELFTGRLTSLYDVLMNLLPMILFAFIGYFIYTIFEKNKSGFSSRLLLLLFFILMIFDQGIKIIIKTWFFHNSFEIIPNFLFFKPIINTDGSWLNARFGTGINFSILIIINLIALFIFIECYRYYLSKNNKDFFADMCFIFISAGALCSLIDKLFYGGSLDFIGISNLFIADFKDIYINLAILFFILNIYFNDYWKEDENSTLKDDLESLKKFFIFIKDDLKDNIIKKL